MLGPNYGKWWNERPRYARLRYALFILPFVLISAWMLYLYRSGAHLRDDIFEAVGSGNIGDVRALISDGAYADAREDDGTSLLHHAIEMDHTEFVPLLIEEGADVNAVDHRDLTPIHLAAGKEDPAIVTLLIEHGADVNVSTPGLHVTPLHQAVRYGHENIVRLLLNSGANVNAYSRLYGTPLHWVAEAGHQGIAVTLLDHDANTSTLDDHQLTPAGRAKQKTANERHYTIIGGAGGGKRVCFPKTDATHEPYATGRLSRGSNADCGVSSTLLIAQFKVSRTR
jgi:hypothetical protein